MFHHFYINPRRSRAHVGALAWVRVGWVDALSRFEEQNHKNTKTARQPPKSEYIWYFIRYDFWNEAGKGTSMATV